MKIGDKVYYLDFADYCVKCGIIYSMQPTSTGYLAYNIIDGKLTQKESSICFKTEDEALSRLSTLTPIAKEIESIAKDAQHKIDLLRKELLGEPTLTEIKDLLK